MYEWIVYIFQMILAVGALFIVFLLLKKNHSYLGNQLLATSFSFVALYVTFIFLYKVLNSAALMQYSIRISFSSLIVAVLFMFLTIEVLTHSTEVFRAQFKRYVVWIVLGVVIIGMMIVIDWVYVTGDDISTLDYNMIVFGPFAGYVAFMLIFSMIKLYWFGIRKAKGKPKLSLVSFFVGLMFMLLGLVIEGLDSAFQSFALLFDIMLFLSLVVRGFVYGNGFIAKKRILIFFLLVLKRNSRLFISDGNIGGDDHQISDSFS